MSNLPEVDINLSALSTVMLEEMKEDYLKQGDRGILGFRGAAVLCKIIEELKRRNA